MIDIASRLIRALKCWWNGGHAYQPIYHSWRCRKCGWMIYG